jgi:uncharacterized protein YkwD
MLCPRNWARAWRRLAHRGARAAETSSRRASLFLERLEAREVLSGYTPTGVEQEFLERLNDARANPAAYGRSIGLDLSGIAASQPLAFNTDLVASSRNHSVDMDIHNFFAHNGSDGSDPGQRMAAAGYAWSGYSESIAAGYATPEDALAGLIIDSGTPDLGHRHQLLSYGDPVDVALQETGVGIVLGGTGAYHNYYTIDSGYTADTNPFLTGVVYNDLNHNGLYDNGEGLGGVTVSATGSLGSNGAVTWPSGGYSFRLLPGTYTVTASGPGLVSPVSRVITVGSFNVRLNFNPPSGTTRTTVKASANPAVAGQTLTLTATVAATLGTPTGMVEFFDGATDLGPGSTLAGSGGNATSVFTTSALGVGPHTLKAVYTPTGKFIGSQGTLAEAVRADHLGFGTMPAAVAGQAASAVVQVQLLDQQGNLLTSDNIDKVTLMIALGPGKFAAGSTTTVTASGGVATFSNLGLTAAGTYTLLALATAGVSGPSADLVVSPAAADHLAFTVQPSDTLVGQPISPAIQVELLDRYGNVETGDNSDQVTVAVANGQGSLDPASTTTVTVNAGVATFDNLVYTTTSDSALTATFGGGVTPATSAGFTVLTSADNFNRPNSATLGNPWVPVSGAVGIQNQRAVVSGGTPGLAVYGGTSLTGGLVQATIALSSTATQSAGLVARYSPSGGGSYYLGQVVATQGAYTAWIWRVANGQRTNLASVPVTRGSGTLRFQVVGSSLKLFVNGQMVAFAFDSTLTSGTPGIQVTTGAQLSHFEVAALSPVAVALPFTDSFAQTAGKQLSLAWTEQAGNFTVLANGHLRPNAGGNVATVNQPPAADVAVQANVTVGTSAWSYAGLVARYAGPASGNMYTGLVLYNGSQYLALICRKVNGHWTTLSSQPLAGGAGLLLFQVQGSSLKLFFNGQAVGNATDSAITGPGLTGLRGTAGTLYASFAANPV